MKKSAFGLVIAALAFSTNVHAAIILTFEGIPNETPVGNFYNGGAGPNYGISFSSGAVGSVDFDAGGNGNFGNEPSPSTVLALRDSSMTLNYAGGFRTSLSFFYSSARPASVLIWDGLDGTGNLLASTSLVAQFEDNNCWGDPTGFYCNWTSVEMAFAGTARSVEFRGSSRFFIVDDIRLVPSAATQVPLPASLLMLGTGLLAGAWVNRKSKPRLS